MVSVLKCHEVLRCVYLSVFFDGRCLSSWFSRSLLRWRLRAKRSGICQTHQAGRGWRCIGAIPPRHGLPRDVVSLEMMRRLHVGSAKLPNKGMQRLSSTLALCTTMAEASQRTKPKLHVGSAKLPNKGMQRLNRGLARHQRPRLPRTEPNGRRFRKAAEQGNATAQYLLGRKYAKGKASRRTKPKVHVGTARPLNRDSHKPNSNLAWRMNSARAFRKIKQRLTSG